MIRLLVVSGGRVLAGKKITPGSEVEQNLTSLLKTRTAGDPDRIGKQCYPDATSMLLLLDCGGRNASNRYIFKHYLQQLADRIGMEIRVAHYPSYCSKYNRIERRLFPHITRACTGMLFDSLDTVLNLMRSATTSTGLKTTVNVIRRACEIGQNATDEIKQNLKIVFDRLLPKWNYTAIPQPETLIS